MTAINRRSVVKGMGLTALAMTAPLSLSAKEASKTPTKGGILKVGLPRNDSKTFDPRLSGQPEERAILYCLYNTLTAIQPDLSLEPELAESWKIENDGKRYVFNLKQNVKFHDGTPFDAEAVKFNIVSRIDESIGSPQAKQIGPVIASIDIVSPSVVAFNLNYPYPALLADLADRIGCMVSPTAAKKFGPDFGRNPVGTGPFKLKEWVQGTSIKLERYADYWMKDAPYLDGIDFITVPNVALGLQRMGIGEIDHIDRVTPQDLRQVDKSRGLTTVRMPEGRFYAMGWQVDTEPFKNAKLRQAIAYAIDRDRINQIVLGGQGKLANGFTPKGYWFYNEPKKVYEFSQEKAKALLKESGWPADKAITLTVPSSAEYTRISQLVGEQLEAIGLKVSLQAVPQTDYWPKVLKRELNFGPTSWTVRPDPDTLYYYLLHPKGAANTSGYNNPEASKALEAARATTDKEERRRLYGIAEEAMMNDLPFIMLYFTTDYVVLREEIGGYQPLADQVPRFRYLWKTT